MPWNSRSFAPPQPGLDVSEGGSRGAARQHSGRVVQAPRPRRGGHRRPRRRILVDNERTQAPRIERWATPRSSVGTFSTLPSTWFPLAVGAVEQDPHDRNQQEPQPHAGDEEQNQRDRKSTRLNSQSRQYL